LYQAPFLSKTQSGGSDLVHQKPFNHKKQSKTMPLRKGTRNIGANIEELMSKGRSFEQSKVIALKVAGKYKKLKK